jgi:hypothetical protein
VAEQLALDEVLGDGAAVHRDEGAGLPRARLVDRLGDGALAGARLAEDDDRGVRLCDALEHGEDLPHPHGSAHERPEAIVGGRRDVDRLEQRLEAELHLPCAQDDARAQVRLANAELVDPGAIGGGVVADDVGALLLLDDEVQAAHGRVGDDEIALLALAHPKDRFIDLDAPPRLRTRHDRQLATPLGEPQVEVQAGRLHLRCRGDAEAGRAARQGHG